MTLRRGADFALRSEDSAVLRPLRLPQAPRLALRAPWLVSTIRIAGKTSSQRFPLCVTRWGTRG